MSARPATRSFTRILLNVCNDFCVVVSNRLSSLWQQTVALSTRNRVVNGEGRVRRPTSREKGDRECDCVGGSATDIDRLVNRK
jgi:hypothetical protein